LKSASNCAFFIPILHFVRKIFGVILGLLAIFKGKCPKHGIFWKFLQKEKINFLPVSINLRLTVFEIPKPYGTQQTSPPLKFEIQRRSIHRLFFGSLCLHSILSPYLYTFMEPRNRFLGIDSASLCSLAGRYDKQGC
jgi:hypothetical protein